MAIDENIWGTKEEWKRNGYRTTSITNTNRAYALPYACALKSTDNFHGIKDGIDLQKLEDIDDTIAFWGVNRDSLLFKPTLNIIYPDRENRTVVANNGNRLEDYLKNHSSMPMALNYSGYIPNNRTTKYGGPVTFLNSPNFGLHEYDIFDPKNISSIYNNFNPLMDFNYRNIIVVPYVHTVKTATSEERWEYPVAHSLGAWMDGIYDVEGYYDDYVIGFSFRFFLTHNYDSKVMIDPTVVERKSMMDDNLTPIFNTEYEGMDVSTDVKSETFDYKPSKEKYRSLMPYNVAVASGQGTGLCIGSNITSTLHDDCFGFSEYNDVHFNNKEDAFAWTTNNYKFEDDKVNGVSGTLWENIDLNDGEDDELSERLLIEPLHFYSNDPYRYFGVSFMDRIGTDESDVAVYKPNHHKINAIKRFVMKQTAYLGFIFALTPADAAKRLRLTFEEYYDGYYDQYIPEFSSNFVTTGRYTEFYKLNDTDYINKDWYDNLRDVINYTGGDEPVPPPEPPDDPDISKDVSGRKENYGDLNSIMHSVPIHNGVDYYFLTDGDLKNILYDINYAYPVKRMEELEAEQDTQKRMNLLQTLQFHYNVQFKGTNPQEFITSATVFPIDISQFVDDLSSKEMSVGGYTVGESSSSMTFNAIRPIANKLVDLGSFSLREEDLNDRYKEIVTNDFRDFDPYTRIAVSIPFCGMVDLDPSIFMYHTINLRWSLDVTSGICTGYIYCDNLLIKTVNGECGMKICLSLADNSSYIQSQIQMASASIQNSIDHANKGISGAMGLTGHTSTGWHEYQPLTDDVTYDFFNNPDYHKIFPDIYSGAPPITGETTYAIDPIGMAGSLGGLATNGVNARLTSNLLNYRHDMSAPHFSHTEISGANSLGAELTPRLIIYKYNMLGQHDENWWNIHLETSGVACEQKNVLGWSRGMTVASDIKFDDNCEMTITEKQMIVNAFSTGVIMPNNLD